MFRDVDENRSSRRRRATERIIQRANSSSDQSSEWHDDREIRQCEPDDGCPVLDQRPLHVLDIAPDLVSVEAARDDIVRTREERHEVGPQRERGLELLVANAACGATTNREIRVEQRRGLSRCDVRGESVGPTAVAPLSIGIVEPFRRAVADRDVPRESPRSKGAITFEVSARQPRQSHVGVVQSRWLKKGITKF